MLPRRVSFLSALIFLVSCATDNKQDISRDSPVASFTLMSSENTGVTFRNDIVEREGDNYILNEVMYLGAGVGVGDINNDGLQDVYFCGNQVADKLYLNKGNFEFEDITGSAGIIDDGSWSMGVSFADVNHDGLMDITVSNHYFLESEKRRNKVYINLGDLKFEDQAEELGLADEGYSIQTTYLDVDRDGDLDAYVANQPPTWRMLKQNPKENVDFVYSDQLYRNDGNKFVNVTEQYGIANLFYSLNASASDIDGDGWVDIYVTGDYEGPDSYYRNLEGDRFVNKRNEALRHMSNFGMGSDVADVNNDGLLDIYVADMVAEDNYRNKTNMSGMSPERFWALADAGYHYQYMFNTLQLNNGNGLFSEVAQLAGVSMTDWSWSPLLADLDNDGWKDLFVTNGLYRDMRNNDYLKKRKNLNSEKDGKAYVDINQSLVPLIELAPSVRIPNFAYRNFGGLDFRHSEKEWGLDFEGWSMGSCYADLDNDGDLDLIINNMNDEALLYRNETKSNWLRIIVYSENNRAVHNTRAELYYGDGQYQCSEVSPVRGYKSCSENILHFGFKNVDRIDSLIVTWPNGRQSVSYGVATDKVVELSMEGATMLKREEPDATLMGKDSTPFIKAFHRENIYDDYKSEILLPHRMSTLGPHISVGDMNGDEVDDLYLSGCRGNAGSLMISSETGYVVQNGPWVKYANSEELGSCMFDVDNDGDLDLYVASGGNEAGSDSALYQDRLYLNNGSAFTEAKLPKLTGSNSCVKAADIDSDGDQDLFIGGRQQPGKYPYPTSSVVLRNDGGEFRDVTQDWAPMLQNIGMVTDAAFVDHDNDGDHDLIIVGEWLSIRVLENDGGSFADVSEKMGLTNTSGWWNTIEASDMDGDGDVDLVAGNLGLNIKYEASEKKPFKVISTDFDENGTNDIVLSYYEEDNCFPVRGRQCSSEQIPTIKDKFPTYHEFAMATVEQIYGDKMDEALSLEAKNFSSIYLENTGAGFKIHELPIEAQFSAIQGIVLDDIDGDSHMDIIVAGNYYHREVETTRSDASIGYILVGDGNGNFETVPPSVAGLELYQDVRDINLINIRGEKKLVAAVNNGPIQTYSINAKSVQ